MSEKQLSTVVNNVIQLAMPKAKSKNISLESYVNEEFRVHIDETKMQSVILNLIYNGIDAIEENGRITLKIGEKQGNKISLLVQDSGAGIPENVVPKIFDEGFTTKIDGNGQGLAICKKLMEQQYGDLKLVKTGNDGTEFELLIPTI